MSVEYCAGDVFDTFSIDQETHTGFAHVSNKDQFN